MICAKRLIRHMFWSANTFCLIVGLIMTLLCILFMDSVLDFHLIYCIFGLIVGLLTVLSALVGYHAVKEPEAAMMWLHCALLAVLFVTQLYIVTHFQASNVVASTIENIHLLWQAETVSEGPMAKIESRFHCCGLYNYSDYINVDMPLPASCFFSQNNEWVHYNDGCLEKVSFAACRASKALSITGFALITAQILTLIFSTSLSLINHRDGSYDEL